MPKPNNRNNWAVRMAESIIQHYPLESAQWHYEHGLVVKAIMEAGICFQHNDFLNFAKAWVDHFIKPDGSIATYRKDEFNLDLINPGKTLFYFYTDTGEVRFQKALAILRSQLQQQPRTLTNGFWHKKIYPYQMWLDGIYMAGPFLAEYASVFSQPQDFDEIAHQILLIEAHTRDDKTGLLYHAWDEKHAQPWANPENGHSPHFWGRALGWFEMALIDILDFFPPEHPQYARLLEIFVNVSKALLNYQDMQTGMWYQIVDLGGRQGNYLESSVTCMLSYAFAKGVRKDLLPSEFLSSARHAYRGILEHQISVDAHGSVSLENTCGSAGLGGEPYRDGSFDYYVGEKLIPNDFKGVGPFILAALEMETATEKITRGQAE
ncbi:MAG: glycoside hydrolase family 88 protein [Anaerolineaceae bacterium]|nr:glycoside hydrolase family 88 protein [Anaerolineaceae bacterium]